MPTVDEIRTAIRARELGLSEAQRITRLRGDLRVVDTPDQLPGFGSMFNAGDVRAVLARLDAIEGVLREGATLADRLACEALDVPDAPTTSNPPDVAEARSESWGLGMARVAETTLELAEWGRRAEAVCGR
jgi:hypothetical protein